MIVHQMDSMRGRENKPCCQLPALLMVVPICTWGEEWTRRGSMSSSLALPGGPSATRYRLGLRRDGPACSRLAAQPAGNVSPCHCHSSSTDRSLAGSTGLSCTSDTAICSRTQAAAALMIGRSWPAQLRTAWVAHLPDTQGAQQHCRTEVTNYENGAWTSST